MQIWMPIMMWDVDEGMEVWECLQQIEGERVHTGVHTGVLILTADQGMGTLPELFSINDFRYVGWDCLCILISSRFSVTSRVDGEFINLTERCQLSHFGEKSFMVL